MMLIFEGHRENGPATHAAAHAFRARGQQPTRAAKAARIRGAGMQGRSVRAQLTESFQRICAVSMESARRRRNMVPRLARKPDKLSKENLPPHLNGFPPTGSGKGASKEMQTHLNYVSPPSMRFREIRFKQQLGRRALQRRFAPLKTLCSMWTPS